MSPDPSPRRYDPPIEILVVCTGNICRSPMAAGLLRAQLARAGVEADVVSAGLLTEGRPASEHGVAAMSRRGVDISDHVSQRLVREMVERADLVLGMELQHVREVAVLSGDAFTRTFTVPELARQLAALGPRPASEPLGDWIRRAGSARRPADFLGTRPADEVEDPIGRSARRYEATADQLEGLLETIIDHLFPQHGGSQCG